MFVKQSKYADHSGHAVQGLDCTNTGILGSNRSRRMDVSPRFYVGVLRQTDPPSNESYQATKRLNEPTKIHTDVHTSETYPEPVSFSIDVHTIFIQDQFYIAFILT
jgi:hypothetical protein